MSPRKALGEFEHLMMLAIVRLGAEAYGVAIIDELERQTGRETTQARAYLALQRLESKGLVSSAMGEPTPVRGGRAKRYFQVTEPGLERLRDSGSALFSMWEGVDPSLRRARS